MRALAIALILAPAAAQAQPNVPSAATQPPDGTYRYALSQAGTSIGTSDIVIRTSNGTLTVSENADLGRLQATTETTLDAATLNEHRYRGSSPQQGSFSATIDPAGVRLTTGGTVLPFKALAGTSRVIVSDGLVSSFVLLPAFGRMPGGAAVTDVAINGGKVIALTLKPLTGDIPAGVPAGSAGLQIDAAGVSLQEWFDPQTLIVRLVRGGPAGVEIRLTSQTAAVEAGPTPVPAPTPVALPPAHYLSRELDFRSADGVRLAGTLTVPSHRPGGAPGLILLAGSGPLDRDETIGPNKVFAQIAAALSNAGYAVLRYDKRGTGHSGGAPIGRNGRALLLSDAQAALAALRAQPEVAANDVFVLGHSEGAFLAPSVALADRRLRGLILMGDPALPLDQVLIEQLSRDATGAARVRARADAARTVRAIADGTSRLPDAPWLRSEFGIDPAALVARVPVPMLILQGGRDVQVLARHLPRLVEAARRTHRDLTVRVFPDDGHLMLRLPAGAKPLEEYTRAAHVDPAVLEAMRAWLGRHATPKPAAGSAQDAVASAGKPGT